MGLGLQYLLPTIYWFISNKNQEDLEDFYNNLIKQLLRNALHNACILTDIQLVTDTCSTLVIWLEKSLKTLQSIPVNSKSIISRKCFLFDMIRIAIQDLSYFLIRFIKNKSRHLSKEFGTLTRTVGP